ncbi:MAG: AAA family ATPase [Bacteroidetes bacterium CG02_land_8_20_14_3_00_31_25]|nr:ATP-binding protein [Bacteroidota bacterium]PIV58757.1 MAG: AAA family ATPase [Bacteroidetes bacterium CG02_land_8_20_14_3_00_31_25]PIY02571.1 MAG: AAA family ATPase [Bacteroidetes bacterium CG_4_10_14_3_um_filter_31_20]
MILKSILVQIVKSQQFLNTARDTGMKRESWALIKPQLSHALIVSGIRRGGKSTFLLQYLKSEYPKTFSLNFDDTRLVDFEKSDWMKLDEIIAESKSKVLFFDEIQIIEGWERYIRQKLDESYRVFITGSNASLLSRELGTKLTGRHISKELFPFSYTEFAKYKKLAISSNSVLVYLKTGGFPEFIKTGNNDVLLQLFNDVLIRDIAVRYGIRDIKTLQSMALYLISNVGNRITASKLKKQFSFGSTTTVLEYLSHLETSYLFFFVPKFSYSLKSQSINPKKVYSIDTGLISANSASFTDDLGSRFENLIFLHIRRNNNEIYYFSVKNECDFVVCENGKVKELIQACYELNPDNLERETNGLYEAMQFFKIKKGGIVTLNQTDSILRDGMSITVIPAHKFMKM